MNLQDIYTRNCNKQTDINQHLPKLLEYGAKCHTIVEFGVRDGQSTSAFLNSRPQKMISFDIIKNDAINELIDAAKNESIDFSYRIENSNTANFETTDLLFIDSEHTEENTTKELKNAAHKTKKYIIFHDSNYPENPLERSVRMAVDIFLNEHPEWQIEEEHKNSYGLLILKKQGIL